MLQKILVKKNLRSEFVKNAATLISGTAFAQVITLFTAPVLTRIYTPDHYGLLGLYIMVTTLVGTLATLQYNNIILVAKEEVEAERALVLCIYLSLLFAVVLLLLVVTVGHYFSLWLKSPGFEKWLYLAPVSVFFTGWSNAFTYFANRQKLYKLLSFNRIISATLVPVVSIGFGLLLHGPFGLFAGLVVSQVIPALLLSNHFLLKKKIRLDFSFKKVKYQIKKYKSFPIYSLPSEFINNFINQLPVLLLGRYFTPAVVGFYNLSGRILGMPVQLVSTAVGEVFRQKAAHDFHQNGNCLSAFKRTFYASFLLSLVPFLTILFFGPALFAFFFGDKWTEAGTVSQVLMPLFMLRFTVSPLSYMFIIAGRQREDLVAHIGIVMLIGGVFIISTSLNKGYQETLLYYSILYSATYIYYLYRSWQFSKGPVVVTTS